MKKIFNFLFKENLSYIFPLSLAFLYLILSSILNLSFPLIIKNIVDSLFLHKFLPYKFLVILGFIFVARSIFIYRQNYIFKYIGCKITSQIRKRIFHNVMLQPLHYFDKSKAGDVISNFNSDLNLIYQFITSSISKLFISPFVIIFCLIIITYFNWKLSLLSLVLVSLVYLIIKTLGEKIKCITKLAQEEMANLNIKLQENINLIKIIKALSREKDEVMKFDELDKKYLHSQLSSVKTYSLTYPIINSIFGVSLVIIIFYLSKIMISENITVGTFTAFLMFLFILFNSFFDIGEINLSLKQVSVAIDRISKLYSSKISLKEEDNGVYLNDINGSITFRNIYFSYDGNSEKILNNINFKVNSGEKIAIIGESGEGKTTIMNLLLGLYDGYSGEILVDGVNIKDININSLREQIGVVLQEPILFNTTIKENIKYGKLDATDEEIISSAKIANAHNFIMQLPDKYDTVVGDKGCRLSMGERQRICIARAIIKNPKILILDEPTSSIDKNCEKEILDGIYRAMEQRTTIIIAHRESTLEYVDRVLVLEEGKIKI